MTDKRFTFAIVSDTHIRPRQMDESSPWQANAKANGRARYLVERLRQLSPDFVLHLGDMVHPVPKLPSYDDASELAVEIFNRVGCPVHFIPGNHDIGDKPLPGLPAEPVTEEALKAYSGFFGKDYYVFSHKGLRFIMLNAELLNTGLPQEVQQETWLSEQLATDGDTPTIVCMHYPPFLYQPDEVSSYDNIDEPARSRFLKLFEQKNVRAVFSGHVHHFFHHRHADTDLFIMPAICFTRQDYSELSKVTGDNEWGRDDAPKLGFALVDVDGDDFTVRVERTHGRELAEGETLEATIPFKRTHPKDRFETRLGVHLRHDWTEIVHLPHNPMEEFVRREVRNDYPLLALTEMGAGACRIPISDLTRPVALERVRLMAEMGVKFTVFHFGPLLENMRAALSSAGEAISAVELVCDWRDRSSIGDQVAAFKAITKAPIFLSRVHSGRDKRTVGTKYHHFVSSGFSVEDWDRIDEWRTESSDLASSVAGFAFRVPRADDLWAAIESVGAEAESRAYRATAFAQLSHANPALGEMDDLSTANRVAEAFLASAAIPDIEVFLDTFNDVDRGYFPRSGLYDRLYNPRLAGIVYRSLNSYLNEVGGPVTLAKDGAKEKGCVVRKARIAGRDARLILPTNATTKTDVEALTSGHSTVLNLATDVAFGAEEETPLAPRLAIL